MNSDTFSLFLDLPFTALENWNENIFLTLNSEDNIIYPEGKQASLTFYLLRELLDIKLISSVKGVPVF